MGTDLQQSMLDVVTSVLWLFEIIKNCQFRFINDFRISESENRWLLVFEKNQNQRTVDLGYCKNLKELAVFMKNRKTTGHFMVSVIWFFSKKLSCEYTP
jgi:hypothetical protein